ncbi:myomesin-3 isoform X1 [Channa argus]|uniref:myomesin-3 isoform X1 n=2 Tax=Channa argus TaxID=215402 RepID=UPI00352227DC
METRMVTLQKQEEQSSQMSHSIQLSSQIKKKNFTSRNEEASYSDFYPIIPADLMSIKEILSTENLPRHRTWEILEETLTAGEEEYHRDKWTLFGNEAEKFEQDVIRNQRLLRTRVDKTALRQKAEKKACSHIKYLDRLSQKAPDFPIPLRAHTIWEGMTVKLSCTICGSPPPKVTWYKDGVPLRISDQPWNYSLQQTFGFNSLEIRRCTPDDAGEYKVAAKNPLGEAMTFATLVVNSYQGAVAGSEHSQTAALHFQQEAHFGTSFPPTWVMEGDSLTLECTFTSDLRPIQQDVSWFRDGIQLHQSSNVDIETANKKASITLKAAHKEHEGVYTARLRTWDGIQEHSAFVYVKDASAAVLGGPASPLDVQVSDVNKDYVFLTWQPPSADGGSPVEGYYVERYDIGHGEWVRCNVHIQKMCHFPVFGLKEGTLYQFRVRAVNKAGAGRPSKATEPVLTADPLEHTRTMVVKVDIGRTITITKDELEGQVKIPFPPTNVHACEVSDTYVVLSWTEPEPRGREPLTFYVERSLAGKSSWELASLDLVVNSPRFPVFDLVKGKEYCFRVRSINKHGVSDPSEPSEPISLGKPQAVPAPPHSVMAFRDTDTSVLLQWQEPKEKDDILGYYLYYNETGKKDWNTVNNKPFAKTRFTVHGLKTQKEYVFRVKSVGRAGNSNYSDESRPIVVKAAICVPSAPSAIALLLCTESEMVLGWRAPACNGGVPVRGYYLDQREKGMEMWREVNVMPAKERQFKVCNLSSGHLYQFRVFAANVVGVGKPSEASEAFLCEKWTMPEPGCPYDLQIREVRDSSLVLLWAAPLYEGRSPVTGYLLEISQGDKLDNWTVLDDKPACDTHYKVSGLQPGQTYCFRVSATNEAGVGCASLPTEPVVAQTKPGTRNIDIGVDNDGFIFLGYEADKMNDESEFLWSKDYTEPIDASRARAEIQKERSVLTFTDPSEEDLGLYTVEVSDNPNLSSSYDFTAEDLERLKELSWQVRNPLIGLKTGWQVEVSELGDVRLWLQTENLSDDAELRLIFNDQEITSTPHRKINFDKAKGLVEILFDRLAQEDEGSYTAQLRDGRAKNQFTLVFVDQKFHQMLALADAKRRDHQRKSGPYFQEFLSWSVNEECELVMKCKVTNTNKDTSLKWFKDGMEVTQIVYDQSLGVSTLTIPQVTKKDAGSYRAVVSDKRGEDVSTLELLDNEYDEVLQQLSKRCALSAGPLSIQSTAAGFRLYCSLKYYVSYLKTSWHFKEKRIDQDAKTKSDSSMQKVWIDIFNPTENDKGKYSLEMFDGKETHKRYLDLSGQAFADALLEYQRLKQSAIAEKNRARVIKGLPDVVAIMEGKSLCLTCFIDGEPAPEISWLRNDREIVNQAQFTITKEPKCSTITIHNVKLEDSGKYSIFVCNQFGSETVDVTVSVYKCGEKPPENAVEMG